MFVSRVWRNGRGKEVKGKDPSWWILIQAVQGCIQPPWEIHVLVQDILFYLQQCNHVKVQHIFREGNRVADWLAKLGLSLSSTLVWNQVSNRDLLCLLQEDILEYTLARRGI